MKRTLTLSLFLILIFFNQGIAQEAKIKSGIIYYFTNYVEWPSAKSSGDFVIGVVGNSDIKPFLDALAKAKKVGSRKIIIKTLKSASEGSSCNIIYLPNGKTSEFTSATSVAKSNNCLLVTETNGYGKKGAGINFIKKNGKPSFEINQSAVSSCGLKVSSKLSALGSVI